MSETSPKWKKPFEIMKVLKKRKPHFPSTGSEKTIQSPDTFTKNGRRQQKRTNPFCQEDAGDTKKQRRSDSSEESNQINVEHHHKLNNHLLLETPLDKDSISKEHKTFQDLLKHGSSLRTHADVHEVSETVCKISSKHCPFDWSLKTKVRFMSPQTFGWCQPIKSVQQANGLMAFVTDGGTDTKHEDLDAVQEKFIKNCMVWMHPNLPWLKLYPRMTHDSKMSKAFGITDEDIAVGLSKDWKESFTSVFYQLRSGHCPYFYMLCAQFTVLFCGSGVNHKSDICAMVSPTTRGFREALNADGIPFQLPLQSKKKNDCADDTGPNESIMENCSDSPCDISQPKTSHQDEASSDWLDDMGLDKGQFPSLQPKQIKLQRDSFRSIDNRPESLVLVQGCDTQALINYLLNCRNCLPISGPQANIPPTLLAPKSFKGASLKPLKVHQSSVKQQISDGSFTSGYTLELVGPILPQNMQGLCKLFENTQQQQYSAYCSIHEPTIPFNTQVNDCCPEENQSKPSKSNTFGKNAIRELTYDINGYTWSV